ncbi:hypothetical protein RHS04_05700 [Rhizoctonia solani]|uniref:Uncharacterized protein n=1 Tax=Rhizoctonia solani TaxID=456999 RepID=A0A8H7H7S3_9AGAM|nr:hypothetical protein RHS04_05700 [Rhizoctonia solani]
MSYVSPFLNPGQYVTDLNNLSSESIAIDEAVARAIREARDFSNKYSSDFSHVTGLKDALEQFEPICTLLVEQEEHPTGKYQLDGTPGPKKAFEEIEGLADKESKHVADALQDSNDWHKAIAELKQNLPRVQSGVRQIADASEKYATKLG